MPQKFINKQGKRYYLGYTYTNLKGAKEFVFRQRQFGVVCFIKKSPPFYYVYCPYRGADSIYTKKAKRPVMAKSKMPGIRLTYGGRL